MLSRSDESARYSTNAVAGEVDQPNPAAVRQRIVGGDRELQRLGADRPRRGRDRPCGPERADRRSPAPARRRRSRARATRPPPVTDDEARSPGCLRCRRASSAGQVERAHASESLRSPAAREPGRAPRRRRLGRPRRRRRRGAPVPAARGPASVSSTCRVLRTNRSLAELMLQRSGSSSTGSTASDARGAAARVKCRCSATARKCASWRSSTHRTYQSLRSSLSVGQMTLRSRNCAHAYQSDHHDGGADAPDPVRSRRARRPRRRACVHRRRPRQRADLPVPHRPCTGLGPGAAIATPTRSCLSCTRGAPSSRSTASTPLPAPATSRWRPTGAAHRFVNVGTEPLRMTAIHTAARMDTEWLD